MIQKRGAIAISRQYKRMVYETMSGDGEVETA
jgi:hypothetical protein